jgi:hypothetical protein
MAHALQTFRTGGLADAVLRFVGATLRRGFDARTREQNEDRDRTGALDVATMRDIGARREYQDYGPSARVPAYTARRLHCIADSARCGHRVFRSGYPPDWDSSIN